MSLKQSTDNIRGVEKASYGVGLGSLGLGVVFDAATSLQSTLFYDVAGIGLLTGLISTGLRKILGGGRSQSVSTLNSAGSNNIKTLQPRPQLVKAS